MIVDTKRYKNKKLVHSGDILKRSLAELKISGKTTQHQAFPEWEQIVGKEIAAVARPTKISRGNLLIVQVIDAVWVQELSLQKKEILTKVQDYNEGAMIEDLKFVTGNPKDFSLR